jgi:DMSO/TMAO reductase YedYZ molybdopterin-dependent catalytic subunit
LGLFTSTLSMPRKWVSSSWAQVKQLLPKGFPKEKIIDMNPAEIDSRNLDIDALGQFGTMGTTDLVIDLATYRLKISGEVKRPLLLSCDEILKLPPVTEDVLLICPGFFSNHGRWTGVPLETLLDEAEIKKEAQFVDVKSRDGKVLRISIENIRRKKIFLAYQVNGQRLPQKHGFPLRLVYEGVYGADWVKFVDEIGVAPWPSAGS